MPANKKYLSSVNQRITKITAGIIGGYFVTMSFHILLGPWIGREYLAITVTYSGFIMWVILMIVAFLMKNGAKIWAIYLLITALFSLIIFFSKQ